LPSREWWQRHLWLHLGRDAGDLLMADLKEVSDALAEMDLKGALREAFGKCPKCGSKATGGYWLAPR
jgi:hypothetical protein